MKYYLSVSMRYNQSEDQRKKSQYNKKICIINGYTEKNERMAINKYPLELTDISCSYIGLI